MNLINVVKRIHLKMLIAKESVVDIHFIRSEIESKVNLTRLPIELILFKVIFHHRLVFDNQRFL